MKKLAPILLLIAMFCLGGCAAAGSSAALAQFGSVSEAATQAAGATSALTQLLATVAPAGTTMNTVPQLDPQTAQTSANYMGWANLGLKALGIAASVAGSL